MVESFEHVKVTEEIDDVLCEACLQDSQHFTNLDETAKSINKVAFENDDCVKSQRPIVVHINNSKKYKRQFFFNETLSQYNTFQHF